MIIEVQRDSMKYIMVKSSKKNKIPVILLVGSGRFGKNHLNALKELDTKKKILFKGVVVRDDKKRKEVEKTFNVKTYKSLAPSLLKEVDVVDIVTPPETHFELVKKCLPYTNVFVEKPLATKPKDSEILVQLAKKYKRSLSVGHIFRYHSVSEKLKTLLGKKRFPTEIKGLFINPTNTDQKREPTLEMLHLFDIVHYIFDKDGTIVHSRADGRVSHTSIRYEKNCDAYFSVGWEGNTHQRTLHFKYETYTVEADFVKNIVTEKRGAKVKIYTFEKQEDLITKELKHFLATLGTKEKTRADGLIGKKIADLAIQSIPKRKNMPTVAIIGGGVFGTSIAAELAPFSKVTIFEKNTDILKEGTYVNCFRHHSGYHYPRSSETVLEIKNSQEDFEKVYKKAIVRSYPTYYGIAKNNSHFGAKDFLAFCDKHTLPYEISSLPDELLSKDEVDLCVKVPEPGYHYETLIKVIKERLAKQKNIKILCNSKVNNLSLSKDGQKTLSYSNKNNIKKSAKFDFVINATYANLNQATSTALFKQSSIRIDLTEVLVITLKIPPISITVIDGQFATLIPTGNKNEFTLYHVKESILDRYVPENGLIKKNWKRKSNRDAIIRESTKLYPVLKDAVVTESRIVHRAVRAYKEHDDSRVVDLIEHGFGCWSILSGKILTSVTTGKKVAEIIKKTLKN